jgi:hypothetical protein
MFENTKVAAYYLWDHTRCESALDLWYCAEDIACYFEQMGIRDSANVGSIKKLGVHDLGYIQFVRHVAYRIYIYTNQPDAETNWFAAERLLGVPEWVDSIIQMADALRNQHTGNVRSENVRAYYNGQT